MNNEPFLSPTQDSKMPYETPVVESSSQRKAYAGSDRKCEAEVELRIAQVLKNMGAEFNPEVVDMLTERVFEQQKIKGTRALMAFADVITKNWAIDQIRRLQTARNRVLNETVGKAATEFKTKNDKAKNLTAEIELKKIITNIDTSLSPSLRSAMLYTQYICIDGLKDEACAHKFPGTTRNQRYQWLRRARVLILPKASDNLRDFLEVRMKQKQMH
jgi:DNA-directed RNA polymerase specialized sigma24 family protein